MTFNCNNVLSDRATSIKPSGIRRFFDLADNIKDVITLSLGEPDFKTPWHIREAGINALRDGYTKYTSNAGIMPLREAISAYLNRRFNLSYDPAKEILVTVGGSEGIDAAMRSLINAGDEVLIPEPSFVCYSPLAALAGGTPVMLPTYEKDDFKLMPEILSAAITDKTKVLVLPFPNNPTGALMQREDYEKIAAVLRGTNIAVISDEIYIELTYTKAPPVSFAQIEGMQERTFLVNGFSKAYAMTGWRMGYLCGPKEFISNAVKIHQYGIMCAPTTSQYAAIEALNNGDSDIEYMRENYNMRRRFLLDFFKEMDISCFEPLGAFYVFPNIKKFGLSSEDFCTRFLNEAKVAVVPGNAFGDSGEGFIRISYAYSMEHLKKAMVKMEQFINNNRIK